ncbi:hypothetical protein K458DRAFT_492372 [Lentithecium fluviatile CBS 122367]|uniref:Mid2 domain-containing protein n=1 Tax=Lentithecium fluviatile CBS 122367 TaxID=1168545 RepID=A0A6G1IET8_9PLEO|nr:hypothetical protein K458DRAFT_492372 [Lentithecium fluviatile CBS 122367]
MLESLISFAEMIYSLVVYSILLNCARADADAACYLPNGSWSPGFFACDPTAFITSCCPTGWTCYSNSMCVVTDPSTANSSHPVGTSIRASCTNPKWNNAICGDFCLTERDLSGNLEACGDNKFCCADDPDCSCANGAFQLNPGRVQTIIGAEGLEHTTTSTLPVSTSSAHTSSASSFNTAVRTPTSTGSQTPAPTAQVSEKKLLDEPGVKAGVALGVVFGVILLIGVALLVWKFCFSSNHKNNRRSIVIPTSKPAGPNPADDPYVPGNAANYDPPPSAVTRQSNEYLNRGDAPLGNAYERDIPSPNGFVNSSTTVGAGVPNDGYNGNRGFGGRPLSWVSDEGEGESRYVRPRASELGF